MPVVAIRKRRLAKLVGASVSKIEERLPYIGLDIESSDRETVRVEYSPNRPDFGTDYGIARALRGVLGLKTGLERYEVRQGGIVVSVDRSVSDVRPFIACVAAKGLRLDDEDIRQLVSLQEDLHNGLGRRRRLFAIGLHDSSGLTGSIAYRTVGRSFGFVPLGSTRKMTMDKILDATTSGREYRPVLKGEKRFPIIEDSSGTVLSFPPIINGEATKVGIDTSALLVEVTGGARRGVDEALAIIATTLSEMGGRLASVRIRYPTGEVVTPDLSPGTMALDTSLVSRVTGLSLTERQLVTCLARCGLEVHGENVLYPCYRKDIMHPVDVAEEAMLGYGVDRIRPVYPVAPRPGQFNGFDVFADKVADLMSGAGMVELMTYELTDLDSVYTKFGRPSSEAISVEAPRSREHAVLRDSLLPTLIAAMVKNAKEDYPQQVFEVGRVYSKKGNTIVESWMLGSLIAHAQASFSEAKSQLETFCRDLAGFDIRAKQRDYWPFSSGRSASVALNGKTVGYVGEVKAEALVSFGLGVPVSGFEVNLTSMYKHIK